MRTDDELVADAVTMDPDRSTLVLIVGTKGSGKSEVGHCLFDEWPYDRAVLDVTGDARPDDPLVRPMTTPWPATLPAADPDKGEERVTAWLRVDPRSDTYQEDQDQAVTLALYPRHRKVLLWVDEYGELATASKIPRNTKLLLQSSRHYNASALLCCPRPINIPRLTIQQADKIFVFRVPDEGDRAVLAKTMGFPFREFERAYYANQAKGEHHYLLWDSRLKRLFSMPPLPIQRSHGGRA